MQAHRASVAGEQDNQRRTLMSQATMRWKMHSIGRAAVTALALLLFSAARSAEATTVLPMDVAQLSDRAEIVFTGTAVQSTVALSKDGSEPYTFVTFNVHEVLKGWTLGRQLTLRFTGGEIGGSTVRFEGMPAFEPGETYLLFVRGNGTSLCPVVGWWQGQFRYSRQAGSRKQILVDSADAPVRGVEQGRFQRGSSERAHIAADARVVAGEQTASAEAPDADQIVGQLRSFIAGRKEAQSFRPGRRVDSARTEDVPARAAFSAARPH
jgi:hypothetical protein